MVTILSNEEPLCSRLLERGAHVLLVSVLTALAGYDPGTTTRRPRSVTFRTDRVSHTCACLHRPFPDFHVASKGPQSPVKGGSEPPTDPGANPGLLPPVVPPAAPSPSPTKKPGKRGAAEKPAFSR